MRLAHPDKLLLRRAVGFAGVLLVAFVGACKGKEKGTPDTTHPIDTSAAADSARARDSAEKAILDMGIPGTPGENEPTRAYLTRVRYVTPAEASDTIDADVQCNQGNTPHDAHLRIMPVHYAHQIPWDKVAASTRFHLYARIEVSYGNCPNLGLKNTLQYGVGFLGIGSDAAGDLVVKVFRKTTTGVVDTGISSKKITYCKTTVTKPGVHLNKPVQCTDTSPTYASTRVPRPNLVLASLVPTTAYFRVTFLDSGVWVSCTTGCCEVQF